MSVQIAISDNSAPQGGEREGRPAAHGGAGPGAHARPAQGAHAAAPDPLSSGSACALRPEGPLEPLLTNDRARREWAWLCQRVGEGAARAAIARLPGARKPYPLNVARVLGLQLPPPEQLPPLSAPAVPPPPEVLQRLRDLRAQMLRS